MDEKEKSKSIMSIVAWEAVWTLSLFLLFIIPFVFWLSDLF